MERQKTPNERWVVESEKRTIRSERALAKLTVYLYQQDPERVPEELRYACSEVLSAKALEEEARNALLRNG